MTGKTHLITGICLGTIVAVETYSSPIICIGVIALSAFGSLVPDVDNKKSILGSKLKIISTITNNVFGHRSITHAPLTLAILFLLFLYLIYKFQLFYLFPLLLGYTSGYLSHLFLDFMTKGGIPLFYPFSKKRFALTKAKTGGTIEPISLALTFISIMAYSIYKISFLF